MALDVAFERLSALVLSKAAIPAGDLAAFKERWPEGAQALSVLQTAGNLDQAKRELTNLGVSPRQIARVLPEVARRIDATATARSAAVEQARARSASLGAPPPQFLMPEPSLAEVDAAEKLRAAQLAEGPAEPAEVDKLCRALNAVRAWKGPLPADASDEARTKSLELRAAAKKAIEQVDDPALRAFAEKVFSQTEGQGPLTFQRSDENGIPVLRRSVDSGLDGVDDPMQFGNVAKLTVDQQRAVRRALVGPAEYAKLERYDRDVAAMVARSALPVQGRAREVLDFPFELAATLKVNLRATANALRSADAGAAGTLSRVMGNDSASSIAAMAERQADAITAASNDYNAALGPPVDTAKVAEAVDRLERISRSLGPIMSAANGYHETVASHMLTAAKAAQSVAQACKAGKDVVLNPKEAVRAAFAAYDREPPAILERAFKLVDQSPIGKALDGATKAAKSNKAVAISSEALDGLVDANQALLEATEKGTRMDEFDYAARAAGPALAKAAEELVPNFEKTTRSGAERQLLRELSVQIAATTLRKLAEDPSLRSRPDELARLVGEEVAPEVPKLVAKAVVQARGGKEKVSEADQKQLEEIGKNASALVKRLVTGKAS